MSKTVEDLIMVFEKARAEAAPFPQHHEDGLYAGIAAVIRAVRDEMSNNWIDCSHCEQNTKLFNEILGDAGDEAADTVAQAVEPLEIREVTGASPVRTAAAPDAPVCEWTPQDEGPAHEIWKTACGTMYERAKSTGWCNKCKAPIEFTEAKT